jgi:hypothetical protein
MPKPGKGRGYCHAFTWTSPAGAGKRKVSPKHQQEMNRTPFKPEVKILMQHQERFMKHEMMNMLQRLVNENVI